MSEQRSVYDDVPVNGEQSEFRAYDEEPMWSSVLPEVFKPQHIDADRTLGPSAWDRECQESGRLNRQPPKDFR